MRFSDMNIDKKIKYGFSFVSIVFVLALIIVAYKAHYVKKSADSSVQGYDLSVNLLQREIDHLKWAQALGHFVHDHKAKELEISADARKCAFGRWYYGGERAALEKINPGLAPMLTAIEEPHLKLHETANTIQNFKKEGQQDQAVAIYNSETSKQLGRVQELLLKMRDAVKVDIDTDRIALLGGIHMMEIVVYGSGAVALALAVFLSLAISRAISRPVQFLAQCSEVIAGGNLEKDCRLDQKDELGQLSQSMTIMVASLRGKIAETIAYNASAQEAMEALRQAQEKEAMVEKILQNLQGIASESLALSDNLSASAALLSHQVEQVQRGTGLQKNRITEASSAMDQMNSTVLDVARNAGDAAQSAGQTQEKALHGAKIVTESVQAIDQVNQVTKQLRGKMDELGAQAQSIGQVMNVISDIADQTNLLALNAAIEAARAGEAGRGFAVVADEVRKLAEKTMGATQEVGGKIRAIQDSVGESLKDMEQAAQAVGRSNELAGASGDALKQIVDLTGLNTTKVQSIAAAAEEQSSAAEHINGSLADVNAVAHETESGMAETVEIVNRLTNMAQQLKDLIAQMNQTGGRGTSVSAQDARGMLALRP